MASLTDSAASRSRVMVCVAALAAFALAFWFLVLDLLVRGVLGVGLGLGGALYPLFFLPPVVAGGCVYQILFHHLTRRSRLARGRRLWWSLGLPMVACAVLLVLCCPTDGDWLPAQLWRRLR